MTAGKAHCPRALSVAFTGALAGLLLSGCLDVLEPDVGPPVRELCRNEDSDPDVDVSFERDIVVGIFSPLGADCHGCHTPEGDTPLGLEIGGLDLSNLTTLRAGGTVSRADIVIPGRPCDSILWQKVTAGPPFGGRMPLSGPPFLNAEQIRLIRDWIAEGARDN